ncbi:MAG: hypothetical protein HQL21_01855 [Candidatus Omnitrophica bacterium]|nr:hypothetical protein [Candidatus Omnitrophota bacterium]
MGRERNAKRKKEAPSSKAEKKPMLSDRQKKVLLIVILAMFVLVPVFDVIRCKASCLKRVKTPYPEIACKYQCPWPWEKGK